MRIESAANRKESSYGLPTGPMVGLSFMDALEKDDKFDDAPQLSLQDIQRLPAEVLAFQVLPLLPSSRAFQRENEIARLLGEAGSGRRRSLVHTPSQEVLRAQPSEATALAEAMQRLVHHGLLVDWPASDPMYDRASRGDVLQLTRLGRTLQRQGPMAADIVRWRLELDLHPLLQPELRDLCCRCRLRAGNLRRTSRRGGPRAPAGKGIRSRETVANSSVASSCITLSENTVRWPIRRLIQASA